MSLVNGQLKGLLSEYSPIFVFDDVDNEVEWAGEVVGYQQLLQALQSKTRILVDYKQLRDITAEEMAGFVAGLQDQLDQLQAKASDRDGRLLAFRNNSSSDSSSDSSLQLKLKGGGQEVVSVIPALCIIEVALPLGGHLEVSSSLGVGDYDKSYFHNRYYFTVDKSRPAREGRHCFSPDPVTGVCLE